MTVRSVPAGFAPLLELEQPRVVTTAQVNDLAQRAELGVPVDVVVRRLRERGWLLPPATRGVWEFAPATRSSSCVQRLRGIPRRRTPSHRSPRPSCSALRIRVSARYGSIRVNDVHEEKSWH